ncbi:MAG: DUF4097 family beta strand repeat protein [Balneolaceae bacterium]|nr:DUF4097 family beta strand repeat protein [Balneolaceae bacterium]MCH8548355.1 DUF4097 domain-containing protein [Balneolaceae bacterium]
MSSLSTIFLALLWFALPMHGSESVPAHTTYSSGDYPHEETEPYRSRFFSVEGTPTISVQTVRGDIEVVYKPGIEGVQVDLYVKREFSLWPGSRNLDNYRIIMQKSGDQIVASVEERGRGSRSRSDATFTFVIQMPTQGVMNLRTVNGNITTDGIGGQHMLQSHSGQIVVRNAEGEVRAATTSGNIILEQITGSVQAKAVSGNITSKNGTGEIRLRTVSGRIDANGTTGALVAATTSGNVSTGFSEVSRGIYVETVSGDIDIFIPMDRGYSIEAKGLRSALDGLDPSISKVERSPQRTKAEIRQGGLPVQLSSVSGQIRVREI